METTTKTQAKTYPEYSNLDFAEVEKFVHDFWNSEDIFSKSVSSREGKPRFVFFEGPPSANGKPGIHHVMARALKDIFCRYKTLKGFQVKRKGGWDTHGLPVELNLEKRLGITKEDIGTKISIAEYNQKCRESVLEFKDEWDAMTEQIGYWVDLRHPYITYHHKYMETVWWLLKQLYQKDLLYKGYTIQPFSPAAGTGLSSHELNYPGAYQDVKDTSAVAMFKLVREEKSEFLFENTPDEVFFMAWTTTPWTLPSNTALAVGAGIEYVLVRTYNPYTHLPVSVILAKDLVSKYFKQKYADLKLEDYEAGQKGMPFEVVQSFKGRDLELLNYEQLFPFVKPEKPAFKVLIGDFVTTTDGTGVVHLAPTFGSDDFRVAQKYDIPAILVTDEEGNSGPLVDRQGKFVKEAGEFAGRYVKNYTNDPDYKSVDIDISVRLKERNRAFKVEKYEHNYPHCWRTGKPVLYYPLDSWFIRTTAYKDRLVELNKTINWKPESTGSGRFGNWLENLVDWNLSRSRYWGIPLPIWVTEDRSEMKCIGSIEELKAELEMAIEAGVTDRKALEKLEKAPDLHRPHMDEVVLLSPSGKAMYREKDLIDVWFDSGSMPYAQWHYPFEHIRQFKEGFPADFIAEGVDQTRGWFFTLHAIAVMLFDSVAFKNVIANGLVLDENGEKMSKTKGNVVAPKEVLPVYGVDPTRWYMIGNTSPWENLKFSKKGIEEVRRKFFGTLYNTYNFFAVYANIDGFNYSGDRIPVAERVELDRWIISLLNSLVQNVDAAFEDYEPTQAIRLMDDFMEVFSNWYVRQSRRRFWKAEMNRDKEAAYQTLYECLITLAKLMSPVAPFFSERLYQDLNSEGQFEKFESVHVSLFPTVREEEIDTELEARMELARRISSLVHSIRKDPKVNIKIRQPLGQLLIPVSDQKMQERVGLVQELILNETNIKALKFLEPEDEGQVVVKKAKANFKLLGPRLGKQMKVAAGVIAGLDAASIRTLELDGSLEIMVGDAPFQLNREEVEILSEDIPGWSVASSGEVTVAVDLSLTDALKREGMAREMVNRIQNLRKDSGLEVTDRIDIKLEDKPEWAGATNEFLDYICQETLANSLILTPELTEGVETEVNGVSGLILIQKSHG